MVFLIIAEASVSIFMAQRIITLGTKVKVGFILLPKLKKIKLQFLKRPLGTDFNTRVSRLKKSCLFGFSSNMLELMKL